MIIPGLELHDELATMVDIGLSPYDALRTSTYNPALYLMELDEFGTIEAGKRVTFAHPGMAVTLDGIAKGYIVDAGIEVLKQRGFADVLVEAGGDLLASGQKEQDTPWQIGIRSPRTAQGGLLASFSVENRAVATSGDYMQSFTADLSQHHILDPRTGYSAPELASATVTAPTATLADGLATATMVLGPKAGLRLVESLPGCKAYLVLKDLEIVKTL
jgi:thiamine biosynthesis lipoprotein